jgi:dTDP-4-dehydrorhamnose 3,5-epimerase
LQVDGLAVPGALVLTPRQHHDDRGVFLEYFTAAALAEAVGRPLEVAQANCSVSRRGTVRGIHFAAVPPGQAKYVTCARGAVLDVAVDLRTGSPTFGAWDSVTLDDRERRCVYLPEGLGHAFMALTDDATLLYMCSTPYNPTREHGINPLDPELSIGWPTDIDPLLSPKDEAAPTLAEAGRLGLLPSYDACLRGGR